MEKATEMMFVQIDQCSKITVGEHRATFGVIKQTRVTFLSIVDTWKRTYNTNIEEQRYLSLSSQFVFNYLRRKIQSLTCHYIATHAQ